MEYFWVHTLQAIYYSLLLWERIFPKKIMLMTVAIETWNFRYQKRKILFKSLAWTKGPSKWKKEWYFINHIESRFLSLSQWVLECLSTFSFSLQLMFLLFIHYSQIQAKKAMFYIPFIHHIRIPKKYWNMFP